MKFAIRRVVDGKPEPIGMFDTDDVNCDFPAEEVVGEVERRKHRFTSHAAFLIADHLEDEDTVCYNTSARSSIVTSMEIIFSIGSLAHVSSRRTMTTA
jgi:hypothetical protein